MSGDIAIRVPLRGPRWIRERVLDLAVDVWMRWPWWNGDPAVSCTLRGPDAHALFEVWR